MTGTTVQGVNFSDALPLASTSIRRKQLELQVLQCIEQQQQQGLDISYITINLNDGVVDVRVILNE